MRDISTEGTEGHNSASFSLKPLMFQAFACTMAMTAFTAVAGPIGRALDLAPWQMGLAVTAAGLAWMGLARPWGIASDRRGRRPVLLSGLGGFAVAYAALCLFTALALRGGMAPWLVFAGLVLLRGVCGAFYAAVPSTSAALVADHVGPERRAKAMAGLGMASGASMVIGPALAAVLAPQGLDLPLQIIALLPGIAFVVLWKVLPRGEAVHPPHDAQPPRFNDPRLRRPVVLSLVCMFSVSTAQIAVGFYAIDRLGLSTLDGARVAGVALTCVGVAFTLSQMLVRSLPWPPDVLIRIGTGMAGVGFLSAAFAVSAPMLWVCYFCAAAGMGLVWPSISALAANAVERHEQGAAAGTVTAAQGLGTILGPVVGTVIYGANISAPYVLVSLLLLGMTAWGGKIPAKKMA